MLLLSLALAVLLALVHLAGRSPFPRTPVWVSLYGGLAAGYVFMHIFPLLARSEALAERLPLHRWYFFHYRVFLWALIGLIVFYGLQRQRKRRALAGPSVGEPPALHFWLNMLGAGALSLLVGYMLTHQHRLGMRALIVFAVVLALHMATYDGDLRRQFGRAYMRQGRWVLAASLLAGWALGAAGLVPAAAMVGLFAFMAGAIICNVLREELPAEHEASLAAFALGAAIATVLAVV